MLRDSEMCSFCHWFPGQNYETSLLPRRQGIVCRFLQVPYDDQLDFGVGLLKIDKNRTSQTEAS